MATTRHHVKYDIRADKRRTCLMCGQSFLSQGPSNRRCKRCCHALATHACKVPTEQQERTDGAYMYV